MSECESFERKELKDKIAKHKPSPAVVLGQAEEENAGTPSVKVSQVDRDQPAMSDRINQAGDTYISQKSGGGENSSVENTHEFDIKVEQLQHGISRRLRYETDFSFQQPCLANAGFLGFSASPYKNSTLFSQKNSCSNVFPESASKLSEECSFDELERKSASPMSCDLHRNYADSSQNMKPLLEPVTLNPEMLLQSKFSDKRRWNSEAIDSFPSTAKKKRKKTSEAGENSGCKRCNCKKTKCLKLYCDCFAAGVYCAETCACQNCFNKTEYEDTVLETRQQIESRNPLAFTPKIIKHVNNETPSSILADAGDFTPLSGRHKRGCNCKKSKCLKKYCECYQASVGCSDGCRCEGCENVHGRKLGYDIMRNLVSKQNISKKLETSFGLMAAEEGDFVQNQMYNPHNNMAAYTPAFQDSMRNGSPWFGRPDSDLNLMTQFEAVKQPNDPMRWYGQLQQPESDVMTQFSKFEQEGLNLGDAYNMSNHQTWMPSSSSLRWRTSTHYGTNKLSEDQLYTVVKDPEEDPQAVSGAKIGSPK